MPMPPASLSRVLHIGAAATLEDAWAALAARWPSLREVGLRFAGPPVRHAGTMVGNLANGSPIGDTAPVVMALGAQLVLRQGAQRRTVALEDFYLDYMKNRLEPGEFVEAVQVPDMPDEDAARVRGFKISKRYDCDISAVCAGLSVRLREGVVADVRIAFGGMAATVRRAAQAEAALRGRPWDEEAVHAAMQALEQDYTPLSDLRASATYRLQAARGLLWRWWLQTRPHDPLPPGATSVWGDAVRAVEPGDPA